MNKAYNLSLNKDANAFDQWDSGIVQDFVYGRLWKPAEWQDFDVTTCATLPVTERAIVIIPARHHKGLEAEVNKELGKVGRVVLFLLGDEEAEFDITKLAHPNIAVWVQNAHIGTHDAYYKLGTGYPAHMRSYIPPEVHKTTDVFFAGQITHQRREELADVLINFDIQGISVDLVRTKGFTQGLQKEEYYAHMTHAKIAPCPSGAVIPDSFRLFEAMECMTLAIADQKTPKGDIVHYWDWLFNQETPFPKVTNWDRLFGLVPELLEDYHQHIHAQTAWWLLYKRNFAVKVLEELYV